MPPEHDPISLPRDIVDRALTLGERDVAATEALRETIEAYRAEVRPIVEQYGIDAKARALARAEADAEKLESRDGLTRLSTSRPAVMVYTAVLVLIANYLTGLAGIAPPAIKAALNEEAPNVAAPN